MEKDYSADTLHRFILQSENELGLLEPRVKRLKKQIRVLKKLHQEAEQQEENKT